MGCPVATFNAQHRRKVWIAHPWDLNVECSALNVLVWLPVATFGIAPKISTLLLEGVTLAVTLQSPIDGFAD